MTARKPSAEPKTPDVDPAEGDDLAAKIAALTNVEPAAEAVETPVAEVEVTIVRTGVTVKVDGDTPFLVRSAKYYGYSLDKDGQPTVRVTARRGDVVLVEPTDRVEWAVAQGYLLPE